MESYRSANVDVQPDYLTGLSYTSGTPGLSKGAMIPHSGIITVTVYAKGGVNQMTRIMALEWAKNGIRVNAIAPTYFETDMVKQISNDPERLKFINERTPMGRWGRLPELEGIAIFLAAPASDFITGQIIRIDGGWTAC